jgi:hypothetical protein
MTPSLWGVLYAWECPGNKPLVEMLDHSMVSPYRPSSSAQNFTILLSAKRVRVGSTEEVKGDCKIHTFGKPSWSQNRLALLVHLSSDAREGGEAGDGLQVEKVHVVRFDGFADETSLGHTEGHLLPDGRIITPMKDSAFLHIPMVHTHQQHCLWIVTFALKILCCDEFGLILSQMLHPSIFSSNYPL